MTLRPLVPLAVLAGLTAVACGSELVWKSDGAPRPFAMAFPSPGASATGVVYLSRAILDDPSVMYSLQSGALEVTSIEVSEGRINARGTFSGMFENMAGGDDVEITDGRFAVDGVPHLDDVTPSP